MYCKNCKNWDFLTGDEKFTHRLGIESFKIFAGREEEAEGGFAHSGAFSLVDTKGFIRGVYNITGFDGSVNNLEYYRLLEDLKVLLATNIDTQVWTCSKLVVEHTYCRTFKQGATKVDKQDLKFRILGESV